MYLSKLLCSSKIFTITRSNHQNKHLKTKTVSTKDRYAPKESQTRSLPFEGLDGSELECLPIDGRKQGGKSLNRERERGPITRIFPRP